LLAGKLDAVITGGVAKADSLFTQLGFCQLRALSAKGSITAFDQSADGLVVGEGAAALVLKRLDRALADGDKIRALIRGVGLSNDRSGNILAPQPEGQLRAMRLAWQKAGLSPAQVGLIEAHGTGTILGDQAEVEALKQLLADESFPKLPSPYPPAVIGSVKSNLGHLLSAAGAVGLVKAIMALENETLPPTAGITCEASGLKLGLNPVLRLLSQKEVWPPPPSGGPRIAAVNAFGFGGVNAQVIVEQWLEGSAQTHNTAAHVSAAHASVDKVRPNKINTDKAHILPPVRLLSARAMSAPWPDFASLAQNWMDSEGPPIITSRRFGLLKATGLFFNSLTLEGASLRLAP
ncbi:MAG: polyketide synthase, partial [Candidatus Adiutrix sp.]